MTTQLVDSQGFPRSDIDVYQVTHIRQKVIMLRNDYRAVTEKLAIAMASNFETIRKDIPFAKIGKVEADSPAFEGGIKEGDLLLRFGSIDYKNHRNLSGAVSRNENVSH